MGIPCSKTEGKGRCCCNCRYRLTLLKHPWNNGAGKGRISETMGYACAPPDFVTETGEKQGVFFDHAHGLCEMHEFLSE